MEKQKKKVGKKKVICIVAIAAAVFAVAQIIVLGLMGGMGPLGFLRDRRIAALPGNAEEYHPENLKPHEDSPLTGKRLLFLGSSVTAGDAALNVSMADYLQALDGCEVVKEAVSGTTLVNEGSSSYVARLKQVDTNQHFDAIVCQLSTNDASKKKPLGKISDSVEGRAFDDTTVIGAMETIIAYCQDTWDCPILFYTGTQYDSTEYQAMVDALLELEMKWGITVLDLWNDTDMNAVSDTDRKLYMNDDIHPTQAGYLLWWSPKFQECLYELME